MTDKINSTTQDPVKVKKQEDGMEDKDEAKEMNDADAEGESDGDQDDASSKENGAKADDRAEKNTDENKDRDEDGEDESADAGDKRKRGEADEGTKETKRRETPIKGRGSKRGAKATAPTSRRTRSSKADVKVDTESED